MPQPPERAAARCRWCAGSIRLFSALAPLFRGAGVAGRGERLLLLAALLAPLSLDLSCRSRPRCRSGSGRRRPARLDAARPDALPARRRAPRDRRGRGAAARATWNAEAKPSRFAPRCGTNFAALVVPVSIARDRLWPLAAALYTPFAVSLLSLALTMELWQLVQASRSRLARVFLLPGLALQRVTTREPRTRRRGWP